MENFYLFLQKSNLDLKSYQESGVEWCLKNETEGKHFNNGSVTVRGGLLADEMGLGKTIQMLGLIVANPKQHTLLVLPRALLDQWKQAIIKTMSHVPLVYHGEGKRDVTLDDMSKAPIVLTTYNAIISSKASESEKLIHQQLWDRVIFDEAHHLRNAKTRIHKGAMKLKAEIRWLVTGTPIQNTRRDFNSLCAAMGVPEFLYSKPENMVTIAKQLMLKRTKNDVGLELPELRTSFVPIEWRNSTELELAEDIHSLLNFSGSSKSIAKNKMRNIDSETLCLLTRARQVCIYPPLLEKSINKMIEEELIEDSDELRQAVRSTSKVDTVVSTILNRSNNGRGKLVFCHYRGEIDAIKNDLSLMGLNVETFDGRTSIMDRERILTDKCDVLILQIKTGCEGLNLQHFSEIYFVSPHWNPSVEDQAIARCHRIGQKEEIDVFRFCASGEFRTLEQYSTEVQMAKRTIIEQADAEHRDATLEEQLKREEQEQKKEEEREIKEALHCIQ